MWQNNRNAFVHKSKKQIDPKWKGLKEGNPISESTPIKGTKIKSYKKKKGKLSISPIPVNVVGHFGFCIKVTKYSVKIILQASPYPWYKDSSMSNQTLKNGLKKKIYK